MKHRSRDEHLFGPGPKRILALDGGGLRGMLTLQFLRRIEDILRARQGGDESFRLRDYFDLIGGTSTGSIIAAGLSLGLSVDELDAMYRKLGESIFKKSFWRKGIVRAKFPAEPLREALENNYGDVRMGDDEVATGLAVIAKRLDTGSPWILHNNPRGRYFDSLPGSDAVPNKDYRVRDVVRASTAAPSYFDPEEIEVAKGTSGAFVDGGVSPHNNPSLQLLMLATLGGYGLNWPLGADDLLLVSVGTGTKEERLPAEKVMKMTQAELSLRSLLSLMDDCAALVEQLLQWMSHSPVARSIDGEVGDLDGDVLGGDRAWCSYLRYDADIAPATLRELGLEEPIEQLESLHEMDRVENIDLLARVGRKVAAKLVQEDHFDAGFDID